MKTATRGMSGWARRMMQGAVMVAVATSVPAAWSAGGGIKVNNVVAGTAAITQAGSITTIRTGTRNTIINFQRLSVGTGETLQFIQPSASSRVLNRIQGGAPTKIDGSVWSNGRVYFVNPAGVMFGSGAVINVNQLYASAGQISDADFMAGRNAFTDNTGLVQNDGAIHAQEVHLVGGSVANFGQILTTGDGIVTMTAGKDVYIGETSSPTGQPSVLVKVSSDTSTVHAGTGVENGGTVDVGKGSLHMGAGDVYAAGIYNNGSLKGRNITLNSGANTNVNTGTVDASNAHGQGGSVEITGNKVGIFAGTVDASGSTGGGSVKIGGDFHGADLADGAPTASQTVIGPTAVIKADALTNGNGGQVVVWSNDVTQFNGSISARGGALGGNGGFAEVSGKNNLAFTGGADLGSPAGSMGTLLLDPRDLTVTHSTSANGADDGQLTGDNTINFTDGFPPTTNDFTVTDFKINSLTGNVILQATRTLTVNGTVVINLTTLNQAISFQAGGDLTFNGGAKVTTNHGVILASAGDQNETVGDDGTVQVSVGAMLTSGGGNITLRATDVTLNGTLVAGTGTVAFETNQAAHTIHVGTTGGDMSISDAELGNITSAGTVIFGNTALQTGDITINTADLSGLAANVQVGAGTGNLILTDSGAAPALAAGGNVTINAASITVSNATNTHAEIASNTGTQINLTLTGGAGSTTNRLQIGSFNGTTESGFNGTVNVTAGGNLFLGGIGGLKFGSISNAGNAIDVTAAGDINATGTLAGSTIALSATGGGIGTTGAVALNASTSAALTTTGTGSAGNIDVAPTGAAAPALTITTDAGTSQTVTVESSGALQIANNITAGTDDSLVLHAGTGGTGNLSFAAGPVALSADQITLWAGKGDGSATAALVDLTNTPTLDNGGAAPTSFTLRQDAAIADAAIPAASFITALPTNYTLRSDGGALTLATGANVAGTNLTLQGTSVAINTNLTGGSVVTGLTTVGNTTLTGDVTAVAGDITIGGNLTIKQDTTLDGVDLSITGSVASETNKVWTLTTTFSGTSAFNGGISATAGNALAALTVSASGGTVSFGTSGSVSITTKEDTATNATADGHISIGENLTLQGNTTVAVSTVAAPGSLTAGQADVTFGGTVVSQASQDFSLTVNTGGVTWFKGNVGSGANAQLGGVATDSVGGAFEKTVLGNGGAFSITVGSPITFADDVVLKANTTLTAPGATGNVTFGKTVNSDTSAVWTLAVAAGGTTWFKGNVGAAANGELGALSVSNVAGTTSLGNGSAISITTKEDTVTNAGATGAQSYLNTTTLMGDVTLAAKNTTALASLTAGTDDITLGGAVGSQASQNFEITVNTPGVTWFEGGVSGTSGQELGSITTDLQGGALELTKFGTSGTIVVVTKAGGAATGAQTYNDEVVLLGNTTFRGPSLAFNGTPVSINAGTFNLTLASDSMTFAGGADSVQGTGNLALQPLLDSDAIVIGATGATANTLYLSRTGLLTFKDGFASITIGSPTGTHAITISSDSPGPVFDPVVFKDPVTIQAPGVGGSITVNTPNSNPVVTPGIYGDGNASITLHASAITLNAAVMTNGNDITINGAVTLGTSAIVAIKSYGTDGTNLSSSGAVGGNITIIGAVNDDGTPTLFDLVAAATTTKGNIDMQGAVGGTTPTGGFAAFGGDVKLHGDIRTTNAGSFAGQVTFTSTTVTLAGNANPAIASTITIDTDASGGTANAGAFTASGPIDHLAGTGAVSLVIDTSATGGHAGAPISLPSVGASQALAGLTLIAGTASVNVADVTLTGAFSSSGLNFANSGPITAHGATITQTGTVDFNDALDSTGFAVSVSGTAITVGSVATIDGTTVTINGTGAVVLNGAIAATGAVSVTGVGLASGSGGTVDGGAITLAGGTGAVDLSGAVTGTGALIITGTGITTNAGATLGGTAITLTAGTGDVTLGDTVTGTGLFTSTGAVFQNAAAVSAHGITITHTGAVDINTAFNSAGFAVNVTGVGITSLAAGSISGAAITLAGGTGAVNLTGAATGTGALGITGTGVTTNAGATLGGTTIALNSGTSDVVLGDTVTGTGLFTSNGVGFSNAAVISAHGVTLTHTGAVAINDDLSSAGFAVSVNGSTINVAAGAPVSGSTVALTDTSGITINAVVTGTGGVTSTGGAAFTLASTGGITTTNAAVTITHASGLVTLSGPIAAGSGAVNVSGVGITSTATGTIGGGAITLAGGAGNVSVGGVVTGTGLFTASGLGFTNSAGVTGVGATLNMTGAVTISAALAGGTGAVNVTGTTFNNSAVVTGNSIKLTQSGLATLGAGLTANGGAGSVEVNAAGVTQSAGIINAGSLVLKGTGTFSLAMANTAGTLAVNVTGPVTYTNASSLTVGTAGSPAVTGITTNNGALNLTVSAGTLTVSGAINAGTAALTLTSPNITDASSALTGAAITLNATGTDTVGAAITGTGAVALTGSTISATGGIHGASATLTSTGGLTSSSITATTGDIVLTTPATASISGTFSSGGNFTAGPTSTTGGPVALTGTTAVTAGGTTGITLGSVTGTFNLTLKATSALSTITIGSVGTSTASRLGNLTFQSAHLVQLGGDIFANSVSFSGAAGPVSATVATVAFDAATDADSTLTINAGGGFTMESGQKLTVYNTTGPFGNLAILSNGHAMSLGDLSAQGDINIDAGNATTQITFVQRPPQHETGAPAGLDLGTDVVANHITMKGTVLVSGGTAAQRVGFESLDASTTLAGSVNLIYQAGSNTKIAIGNGIGVPESRVFTGGTALDAVFAGTNPISPIATQGTVIPRDVQTLQPEREQAISGALRDALRELGIYARDLRTDEIIEYLIGRALYDDVPYKLDPGPTDTTVAANRLPYSPVLPTVEAYRNLFFKQEVDDKGNPVTENGKPKMVPQDSVILRALGESWLGYTTDKGDDATPKGFRAYLEAHEKDEGKSYGAALSYLNQLRDLLSQIKSLGLTSTEFDVSRKVLLSKVRPPNIKEDDFMDVVSGPSSRAGNTTAAR